MAMGDQWQFTGQEGPLSVKVRPRMWTNNGDSCVAAALKGSGIQLQPTFLIDEELASGQLVEILPQFRSVELGIYAVYPSRKFVLPKVRAMLEFLANKLGQTPWVKKKPA